MLEAGQKFAHFKVIKKRRLKKKLQVPLKMADTNVDEICLSGKGAYVANHYLRKVILRKGGGFFKKKKRMWQDRLF